MKKLCVVFDLDDTLYHEIDYLRSAYRFISTKLESDDDLRQELFRRMIRLYERREDVFGYLEDVYGVAKERLLEWYRTHEPEIGLIPDADATLAYLCQRGVVLGLITDGRSITQRNKIKALGLDNYFKASNIVISEEFGSEKPSKQNYEHFMRKNPGCQFVYVGDNSAKDFVAPNTLGWNTIGLRDDGQNIHPQKFYGLANEPSKWIERLSELRQILLLD